MKRTLAFGLLIAYGIFGVLVVLPHNTWSMLLTWLTVGCAVFAIFIVATRESNT